MKTFLIRFLVLNFYFINLHSSKLSTDFTLANFHLKWVYDGYLLPLILEKKLSASSTADYKWYKYSENVYIEDINNESQEYFISKTSDYTKLSILDYNYTTHEQLSSYEPRIVDDLMHDYKPIVQDYNYDFMGVENLTDIFTLAYMKSHSLLLNKLENKTEVSCVVKIMLPINDEYINEKNYNLLQRNLYIRIAIRETHSAKHKHRHPHNPASVHGRILKIIELINSTHFIDYS